VIDCLFLDSDDQRHFPADDRRVIHSICTDAEPKIRSALPLLPAMIEFAAQTGSAASSPKSVLSVWRFH
jgi:hypothetical protein